MLSHGFEPNIGLLITTNHCIDMTISIVFDREVEGEDLRAIECQQALLSSLNQKGFTPYRLTINSMSDLPEQEPTYPAFLKKLKLAIDEKNIIAPGRYE